MVDFPRLMSKVRGLAIRLGYGVTEDRYARRNVAEARRLGAPFTVYHYYMPGIDAAAQGEFFGRLRNEIAPEALTQADLEETNGVAPIGGAKGAVLEAAAENESPAGVVLDRTGTMPIGRLTAEEYLGAMEDAASAGVIAEGVIYALETAHLISDLPARIKTYLDRLEIVVGHVPGIYTSLNYWRTYVGAPAWGARHSLWLAAWTTAAKPIIPSPWTRYHLWQFEVRAINPAEFGVESKALDINRFDGTPAGFAAWVKVVSPPPPPVEPLANALWARGAAEPSLTWNPKFALAAAILKDGYHVISGEYDFSLGGVAYKCQNAADDNGKRRVYYCVVPKWSDVRHIDGPATTPPAPKPPTTPTPAPSGTVVNLERAFRPIAVADGQEARGPFMVYQHDDGRTEDAQYLVKDGHTYLIKGSNYEHMQVLGNDIYRFEDTSHGDDTYYTLRDADQLYGSVWLRRNMEIGRPFRREPWVTFFRKSNCTIYAGPDRHETWVVIDRHMAQATLPGGLKVTSVIDLYVGKTEDARSTWFERYWYALGTAGADGRIEVRGLVQWWARNDQGQIVAHSWLADLPQGRAPLPLVKPKCL
jgi:hypothetical protein